MLLRAPRVLPALLLTVAALIALACAAWAWVDVRDFQKGSTVILSIIESMLPEGWPRTAIRWLR